jgi:hypothetical protein
LWSRPIRGLNGDPFLGKDAYDTGALEVLLQDLGHDEACVLEQCEYRNGVRGRGAAQRLVEQEDTSLGCKVFPEDRQLPDEPLPAEQADVDSTDLVEAGVTEVDLDQGRGLEGRYASEV